MAARTTGEEEDDDDDEDDETEIDMERCRCPTFTFFAPIFLPLKIGEGAGYPASNAISASIESTNKQAQTKTQQRFVMAKKNHTKNGVRAYRHS